MKKLLLVAIILGTAACSHPSTTPSGTVTPAPSRPGATSPRGAVEQFLGAVRSQDLQAMSLVWGTREGSARDHMDRAELEKREIILQCYLNHDSYKILSETKAEGGRRIIGVQLNRGQVARTTNMYTISGPNGRWFVEKMDIAALRDFCGTPSS